MLLSNGYKHPENRLKKFEVSLKITSTNLAKKLPSQTLSQTVSHRDFQLLSQTAHVCFHRRKCTHSPLLKGSHTTPHTPKQGPSGQGRYHYPRSVPHVRKPPRAGCQNGVLCRFLALIWCTPEECREPAGQRCAYACRCPKALRPRWAAQTDTAR